MSSWVTWPTSPSRGWKMILECENCGATFDDIEDSVGEGDRCLECREEWALVPVGDEEE